MPETPANELRRVAETFRQYADLMESAAQLIEHMPAQLHHLLSTPPTALAPAPAPTPEPAQAKSEPSSNGPQLVEPRKVFEALKFRSLRRSELAQAIFGPSGNYGKAEMEALDETLSGLVANQLLGRDGQNYRMTTAGRNQLSNLRSPRRQVVTAAPADDRTAEARAVEERILAAMENGREYRRSELRALVKTDTVNRFDKALRRLQKQKKVANPKHGFWVRA